MVTEEIFLAWYFSFLILKCIKLICQSYTVRLNQPSWGNIPHYSTLFQAAKTTFQAATFFLVSWVGAVAQDSSRQITLNPDLSAIGIHDSETSTLWECKNTFWEENIELLEDWSFLVRYPAESSTPSEVKNGAPLWGMWAICELPIPAETTVFSINYTIQIPDDFELWKGMKLHGICFGDCPRWGKWQENWVSLRLHTRQSAWDTFSAYIHSDTEEKPIHHTDQRIYIEPGGTYDISMNINQEKWIIEVYVNGELLYSDTREDFQRLWEKWTWKMMYSTFRGGRADWHVKTDSKIEFWNVNLDIPLPEEE